MRKCLWGNPREELSQEHFTEESHLSHRELITTLKKVHVSTHVSANVKLTNWRGRWEGDGPGNKVP